MKYLILNSAGLFVETCAVNGEKKSYKAETVYKKASEVMLQLTDSALSEADLKLEDVDFIACCIGPGSFTGIRIAVSTARAFSHALNKKIVSFTTLDVFAYNGRGALYALCVSDAGNGFVYSARYKNYNCVEPPVCLKTAEVKKYISQNAFTEIICDKNTAHLFENPVVARPDENALISAALKAYEKGGYRDYNCIEPLYIRQPQAETDFFAKLKETDAK